MRRSSPGRPRPRRAPRGGIRSVSAPPISTSGSVLSVSTWITVPDGAGLAAECTRRGSLTRTSIWLVDLRKPRPASWSCRRCPERYSVADPFSLPRAITDSTRKPRSLSVENRLATSARIGNARNATTCRSGDRGCQCGVQADVGTDVEHGAGPGDVHRSQEARHGRRLVTGQAVFSLRAPAARPGGHRERPQWHPGTGIDTVRQAGRGAAPVPGPGAYWDLHQVHWYGHHGLAGVPCPIRGPAPAGT